MGEQEICSGTSLGFARGRRIQLVDVHVSQTYAGLLEGSPDDAYNTKLLGRAERAMTVLWGPRADPIDLKWCASELVLVWFGAPPEWRTKPAIEIVAAAAADLQWEQWAKDFDY